MSHAVEAPATDVARPSHDPQDAAAGRRPAAGRVLALLARYGTLGVLVALVAYFSLVRPDQFATADNARNVLNQSAILAIVAAGLTFPLVAGQFDLSFGSVISFSGVLSVGLLENQGWPWWGAVAAAIAMGALTGAVIGLLVSAVRVNAIVATLGVSTMLLGFNYLYSKGTPSTLDSQGPFTDLAQSEVLGVPAPILIACVVLLGLWVLLNFTLLGRHAQSVGANSVASRFAGIPVARVTVLCFVVCSACAGLAGVVLSARTGSGQITAGDSYLLDAFAAVFLGASVLRDGQFHILGTLVGVLIVAVTFNGLAIVGSQEYAQYLIQGGILVAATALSTTSRRLLAGS